MPKRDKNREMEERLARIEDGLAHSDIPYAIRQLGDNLDVFKFDTKKGVESLSLYQAARNLDATRWVGSLGHAERLASLYGKVVSAFEAYKRRTTDEASIDNMVQEAPVDDDRVEAIPYYDTFSCIYRTRETRMLDELYKERLADSASGLQFVTSTLMHVFEGIAEQTGYFAGVEVDELRIHATAPSLEQHVMNGSIALKTVHRYQREVKIAVPLSFS